MADSFLILVPLLVLAVVLLLGFAGCDVVFGLDPVKQPSLTLRATVPAALTVLPPPGETIPGVKFIWDEPPVGGEETHIVPPPAPAPSVEAYIGQALLLAPSLFWTLGTVNGLTDRSPNVRNGTPLGGVTVGGEQDGPTDFFDATATQFDGVDDRITSAYNPFVGTSGRTFVGWTRRDSNATTDLLFGSSSTTPADQARLFLRANQDVQFEPSGSDGQVIIWPNAWPGNARWVWWALRFDQVADKVSLFIDGQLVSTQDCTETWPAAPGSFQVGAAGTTSGALVGDSALIAVYEKLLTDADLAAIYQASQPGGGVNVYEHQIPTPGPGSWSGRCEMTVGADGKTADDSSGEATFILPATSKGYVMLFEATGSPLGESFEVRAIGLTEE